MIEFEAARRRLYSRGTMTCRIASDSMQPLLKVGTEVEIVPVREIDRFDLLVFQYQGRLTCHFVWTLNFIGDPPTITTRSLKNPLEDDLPVPLEFVLGKVISHQLDRRTRVWLMARAMLGGKT